MSMTLPPEQLELWPWVEMPSPEVAKRLGPGRPRNEAGRLAVLELLKDPTYEFTSWKQLAKDAGVPGVTLDKWRREPRFRKALKAVMDSNQKAIEMLLKHARVRMLKKVLEQAENGSMRALELYFKLLAAVDATDAPVEKSIDDVLGSNMEPLLEPLANEV